MPLDGKEVALLEEQLAGFRALDRQFQGTAGADRRRGFADFARPGEFSPTGMAIALVYAAVPERQLPLVARHLGLRPWSKHGVSLHRADVRREDMLVGRGIPVVGVKVGRRSVPSKPRIHVSLLVGNRTSGPPTPASDLKVHAKPVVGDAFYR